MVFLGFLLIAPVAFVVYGAFVSETNVFSHLLETVLADYLMNTFALMFGVGVFATIIGVGSAWCVSRYQFWGRSILEWALMLPLAIPAYVLALVYGQIFDVAGPVQEGIRSLTGLSINQYWFPEIRSLGGAFFILSIALYPYIYMLARTAFMMQSNSLYDSAKLLGGQPFALFWRVALPVARPAIIGGLTLVLMETLADFGVVSLYGVPTFVTGIYRTWFDLYDLVAASKLAIILLVFILVMLYLEYKSRSQAQYVQETCVKTAVKPIKLAKKQTVFAAIGTSIPIILGFIFPVITLVVWGLGDTSWLDIQTWKAASHTLIIGVFAAFFTVLIGLFFAYHQRIRYGNKLGWIVQLSTKGYAMPGAVIAIGVLVMLTGADHLLNDVLKPFNMQPGLIFSGSLFAVVFACVVRFLAPAFNMVTSGFGPVPKSVDESAALLGASSAGTFKLLHWPLLKGVIFSAGLIVFIDVVKELPATLILRPFDFDTLAIRTFELALDEQIHASAAPALLLVLFAVLPTLIILKRRMT